MASTLDDTENGTLTDHFRQAGAPARALDAARMLESLSDRLFDSGGIVEVGRFRVLERLGAGAMGVVMSAYDPQLERTVAVKVLREEGDEAEHKRLLDEARAMAKVRHPNLVVVYEAGIHEQAVYIVMEFVEGGTLRRWLEARDRSWQEVVRVFVGAARGLAAIHAAGMVHRDFKPDNVLIGDDGRAQVTDFGLARPQRASLSSAALEISEDGDPIATQTAGMAGTPHFMAPELWEGSGADAASDQWSFSVALHEALYGQRPFQGATAAELCMAVLSGTRTPLAEGARTVPAWLGRLVDRGLCTDPGERLESMEAFATALKAGLEDRRGRTTRSVLLGAGVAAALVGGGAWMLGETPCEGVDARLPQQWTPSQRGLLEARFAARGGEEVWADMEPALDERIDAWARMRVDACEATHVRGEQSEEALDLRMRCLDRRALEIESLLAVYGRLDEVTLSAAVRGFDALARLEVCNDLEFLRLSQPTPESTDEREAVAQFRTRAERLNAEIRAGKIKENEAAIDELIDDAEGLGYEPVIAEAKMLGAKVASHLSRGDRAAELYEHAFELALATRHIEVQVWSAVMLTYVYSSQVLDLDEARLWGRRARALLRAHDYFPDAARAFQTNIGTLEHRSGNFEQAREHFEEGLRLSAEAGLEDSIEVISLEANLGILSRQGGQLEDARERLSSARSKAIRVLGSEHPLVGQLGNSLAMTHEELGDLDAAEALYRESIEQLEARMGREAVPLAHPLNNLGEVLLRRGELAEALAAFDRAIAIRTAAISDNVELVHPLTFRAEVLIAQRRFEDAREDLDRADRLLGDGADVDVDARANLLILQALAVEATEPGYAKRLASEAMALEGVGEARVKAKLEAWRRAH